MCSSPIRPSAGRPSAARPNAGRPNDGRPSAGRPNAARPNAACQRAAAHSAAHARRPGSRGLALLCLGGALLGGAGCKKAERPLPKPAPLDLRPLTPDSVQGWAATGPGRHFDPQTVFELLDGGAEIYLDYQFQRLLHREYAQAGRPTLSVHLFDLGDSAEAWGIFSHEREGKPVDIGQEADYEGGLLRFWRGRYFASLQTTRETGPAREALFALAREIAARIPEAGKRPDLVERLAPEGQRPGSLRYVRTWPALDHHLRLGPENPLGLSRETAVALAAYGGTGGASAGEAGGPDAGKAGGASAGEAGGPDAGKAGGTSAGGAGGPGAAANTAPPLYGLLARYPGEAQARRAAGKLSGRQAPPPGLARACGTLLVGVLGGADAQTRTALLARLHQRACEAKK